MAKRVVYLSLLTISVLTGCDGIFHPQKQVYRVPFARGNQFKYFDVYGLEGIEEKLGNFSVFDEVSSDTLPEYGWRWMKNFYLPTMTSSGECLAALQDVQKSGWFYVRRFIDSWGKWPDGYLWGNVQPLGMFEECLAIENEDRDYQGRYCFVMIRPDPNPDPITKSPLDSIKPRPGFLLGEIPVPFPYNYGTCVPDVCNSEDLEESLERVFLEMGTQIVTEVHCHRLREEDVDLNAADISFIVFLSVLGFILLLAAVFDVYTEKAKKKELRTTGIGRFVMPFSIYTNLRKVFAISNSHSKDSITCLYGIRTITLLWIIWGHQYLFTLFYLNQNTTDLDSKTDGFLFMLIANATFSVDTFFFISGMLVALSSMRQMKKNDGKLNFLLYYVHRYIRLTPAIALVVWYQATIMRHFIHGPISFYSERITESCEKKWWSYLVYVNNLVVDFADPYDSLCLEHAWYTAIDTQLYVLAPLVLIPLFHFKKWGKILLAFLIFAEGIVAGAVTVAFDLPAWDKINVDGDTYLQYTRIIYDDPFLRCGPYLVGIGIGYFLYSNSHKRIRFRYWQLALGWTLSVGVCFALIFGVYPLFKMDPLEEGETSPGVQFFYGGFSRTIWSCAMAWIIIVCYSGQGGPVNTILSHGYFQPLSRLTYTMYLFSLGILYSLIWSAKMPYYFNHINKLLETAGTVAITFGVAIAATLLVESTTIGLEKELLGRGRAEVKSKSATEERKEQA